MLSIVPITATPGRRFSCKIPVDGQSAVLQFSLQYNELAGYWLVDIASAGGKPLVSCLPALPAENILEQYAYLEIGRAYIVPAQTVKEQWPSRGSFGSDWYLVWGDTDGGDTGG